MSKKRRSKKKATAAPKTMVSGITPRRLLTVVVAAVALLLAAVSIHAYESGQQELHDLTVIGQGEPVIVQIHDPNCPTCRRLKKIVTGALESHDSVVYRLANIRTASGKALQEKYAVPHVTLLFFDGAGKHVHTTTGLQTSAQIDRVISRFIPPT
jgi:hypothetical protein